MGTAIRKQYSVTGNVVILASRLEQLNKKYRSQILISREVLDQIDTGEIPSVKCLGWVDVKGRKRPVEVFQLA